VNVPAHMSIRALARGAGISPSTAWRKIKVLDARYGGVLVDVGLQSPRVSTLRLLTVCAGFFGAAEVVVQSEVDAFERRIVRVERRLGIAG